MQRWRVRFHLPFLLSFSLLFSSCGQDRAEAPAQVGSGQGCVWKVSAKGGGQLYLCGTIHLLRASDYPLPPAYEAAYADSEELILELSPGAGSGQELSNRMRQLGTLPASDSLQSLLPERDWKKVADWSGKRGLDPAVMDRFRPWFVSLLMVATEYAALGAAPDRGVDQFFEDRAAKDGKPGTGLETVEQQLALFSGMTPEQEKEVLEQTLAEMATVEAEFENMISAWRTGDLEALQDLLFREAEHYPDLMEAFLYRRNRAWVPELEKVLARGGRAMVLVGAGHLGGELGVISLLRQKGYKVTPLVAAQ